MADEFKLSKEQQELSSQAAWYVYAKMHVSKSAFEDPYWKNMLTTAGATSLLTAAQLDSWVEAEFEVFILFLRHILSLKVEQAQGNAFAQFIHDGGTLKNHKKYQALAMPVHRSRLGHQLGHLLRVPSLDRQQGFSGGGAGQV